MTRLTTSNSGQELEKSAHILDLEPPHQSSFQPPPARRMTLLRRRASDCGARPDLSNFRPTCRTLGSGGVNDAGSAATRQDLSKLRAPSGPHIMGVGVTANVGGGRGSLGDGSGHGRGARPLRRCSVDNSMRPNWQALRPNNHHHQQHSCNTPQTCSLHGEDDDNNDDNNLATVDDFHDVFQELKEHHPDLSMGALRQKTMKKIAEITAEKEKEEKQKLEEEEERKRNLLANSKFNRWVGKMKIRRSSQDQSVDDESSANTEQQQQQQQNQQKTPQKPPPVAPSAENNDDNSYSSGEEQRKMNLFHRRKLPLGRRKSEEADGSSRPHPPSFLRRATMDNGDYGSNGELHHHHHPRNEILNFIKNKKIYNHSNNHNAEEAMLPENEDVRANFAPRKSVGDLALLVKSLDIEIDLSVKSEDKSVVSNYSVLSGQFSGLLLDEDSDDSGSSSSDNEDNNDDNNTRRSTSSAKSLLQILGLEMSIKSNNDNGDDDEEKRLESDDTTYCKSEATPNTECYQVSLPGDNNNSNKRLSQKLGLVKNNNGNGTYGLNTSNRSLMSEYSMFSEYSEDSSGLLVGFEDVSSGLIVGFKAQSKRLEKIASREDVGGFAADFSAWEKKS